MLQADLKVGLGAIEKMDRRRPSDLPTEAPRFGQATGAPAMQANFSVAAVFGWRDRSWRTGYSSVRLYEDAARAVEADLQVGLGLNRN